MLNWLKSIFKKEPLVSRKSPPAAAKKQPSVPKAKKSISTSFSNLTLDECKEVLSDKLRTIGMSEAAATKFVDGLSHNKILEMLRIIEDLSNNRGGLHNAINRRNDFSSGSSSSSPISDRRLKTNVKRLSSMLDKVLALRGVSFEWRQDIHHNIKFNSNQRIGFIAQEVENVIPEVVDSNNEGLKSVQYANLVAVLVEAIKEQQMQIDELNAIVQAERYRHAG